jgi:hypothetical protein
VIAMTDRQAHDRKVNELRALVRNFLHAQIGNHFKRPGATLTDAELAASVKASAEWVDAAISALGLELGEAFNIGRSCYDLTAEQVIESVQANVFGPCGVHVVSAQLVKAADPTKN